MHFCDPVLLYKDITVRSYSYGKPKFWMLLYEKKLSVIFGKKKHFVLKAMAKPLQNGKIMLICFL